MLPTTGELPPAAPRSRFRGSRGGGERDSGGDWTVAVVWLSPPASTATVVGVTDEEAPVATMAGTGIAGGKVTRGGGGGGGRGGGRGGVVGVGTSGTLCLAAALEVRACLGSTPRGYAGGRGRDRDRGSPARLGVFDFFAAAAAEAGVVSGNEGAVSVAPDTEALNGGDLPVRGGGGGAGLRTTGREDGALGDRCCVVDATRGVAGGRGRGCEGGRGAEAPVCFEVGIAGSVALGALIWDVSLAGPSTGGADAAGARSRRGGDSGGRSNCTGSTPTLAATDANGSAEEGGGDNPRSNGTGDERPISSLTWVVGIP